MAKTQPSPSPRPKKTWSRRLRQWLSACARRHDTPTREPVDVVSQFQAARRQPWAAGLAGAVGGLPPFIGQAMAHGEVGTSGVAWHHDPKALVVFGCMLFSMATVYAFGRATFRDTQKAVGFVAAMELAMVASSLWYVRLLTLAVVVAVNMVMTGAGIALAYEAAERRREADTRRARTRAQTRAEQRAAKQPRAQAPLQGPTRDLPDPQPDPARIPVQRPDYWDAPAAPASTSALALALRSPRASRAPRTSVRVRPPIIDVPAHDDAGLS